MSIVIKTTKVIRSNGMGRIIEDFSLLKRDEVLDVSYPEEVID